MKLAFLALVSIVTQQVTARQQFLRAGSFARSGCWASRACELAAGKTAEQLAGINGECSNCIRQLASHVLKAGDYTGNNLVKEKCLAHKYADFDPDTKAQCKEGTLGAASEIQQKDHAKDVAANNVQKDDKGKKEKETLALANHVGSGQG